MEDKVRHDPKLLDDSGMVPNLNGVACGSIHGCETVSILDGKLAMWSSASCVPKKRKANVEMLHSNK